MIYTIKEFLYLVKGAPTGKSRSHTTKLEAKAEEGIELGN